MRLKFMLKLSPEAIERHVVERGTQPAEDHTFWVDLTELPTLELRKRVFEAHRAYMAKSGLPPLDAPTEDLETLLEAIETWVRSDPPARDAFATEMRAWVDAHGSDRLKLMVERGYKANQTYARERAASEFPVYWVDTNESARWRERTDPSAEALALETAERTYAATVSQDLSPLIVWLTDPPAHLDQALTAKGVDFVAGESIHIAKYLGRYSLYLPLRYPREEG
ncbi:MAG TPA: hypothetical protein VGW10_10870 [Solirubrobacteraceae bacterium]|nr:hypothetical protein [Solirubrobacteraceae bacterium]